MTELRPHGDGNYLAWPDPLPVCWCLSDGTPGMENQAVGLAETMGLTPVIKRVKLKRLWRILTPHVMAFKRYAISEAGDRLEPPWPDITIGTGRPSILPAMYVKGQSAGRTFIVQIQDPVRLRHRYNRIVVPTHDGVTGENLITMDGSLHIITPERLRSDAPRWESRFAHLPRPRLAVLLGGPNARFNLGAREIAELAAQLKALAAQGWGLLITGSRRTGAANMEALRNALEGVPAFHLGWNRRQSLFRHARPCRCVHRDLRFHQLGHRSLQHRQAGPCGHAAQTARRYIPRQIFPLSRKHAKGRPHAPIQRPD